MNSVYAGALPGQMVAAIERSDRSKALLNLRASLERHASPTQLAADISSACDRLAGLNNFSQHIRNLIVDGKEEGNANR